MAGNEKVVAPSGENSRIPNWLSRHLVPEDLPRIAEAVRKAESGSSGEIIPVIVHHSQAFRSAKRMLWLIVLLILTPLFMSVDHLYSFVILGVFVFFFILDSAKPTWLSQWSFLVKLLDPTDVTEGVERRAALKFETLRVKNTAKNTGVMIFISYFERRALIIGDRAIAAKIKDEEWQDILGRLLEKIGTGHMAVGLEAAIAEMGDRLKTHFPSNAETDVNELSNELVILDEV